MTEKNSDSKSGKTLLDILKRAQLGEYAATAEKSGVKLEELLRAEGKVLNVVAEKMGITKPGHRMRLKKHVQDCKGWLGELVTPKPAEPRTPKAPARNAKKEDDDKIKADLSQLSKYVNDINSSADKKAQVNSVIAVRKLVSIEVNPPIQEIIDVGLVPLLVELLKADDLPKLQFEAAWALTNVASGTSKQTFAVIKSGAVPQFVRLLASKDTHVQDQCVWALGNIAGESPQCRDLILSLNTVPALLTLLEKAKNNNAVSTLRNVTWTISNLCRGKPPPIFSSLAPTIAPLASLLYSGDNEIVTDACWALSYLSDGSNSQIQAVLDAGVSNQLIKLLAHKLNEVKQPALRIVGNICTGEHLQTQSIIDSGALPCLREMMSSEKPSIRKEACWTVSNITAGTTSQIQSVMSEGLVPPLVQILEADQFDIKGEAAWAVSNLVSGGTNEQIRSLVMQGVIGPLCTLLSANDTRSIQVALEGLEQILRCGRTMNELSGYRDIVENTGGLSMIEELQNHESNQIYTKCQEILTTFWDVDVEAEDDDIFAGPPPHGAPGDDGQFSF